MGVCVEVWSSHTVVKINFSLFHSSSSKPTVHEKVLCLELQVRGVQVEYKVGGGAKSLFRVLAWMCKPNPFIIEK